MSNATNKNYFTTFLQIVEWLISYWFSFKPTINITFSFTNDSLTTSAVYDFFFFFCKIVCIFSIIHKRLAISTFCKNVVKQFVLIALLSTPSLNRGGKLLPTFIRPPIVETLPRTQGLLEAPLDSCACSVWCGLCGALSALSFGGGRQVYLWCCGRNLSQILRDYQR